MKEILDKLKDMNVKIDSKSAEQIGRYWFLKVLVQQLECVSSNLIWASFWIIIFFKAVPFIVRLFR